MWTMTFDDFQPLHQRADDGGACDGVGERVGGDRIERPRRQLALSNGDSRNEQQQQDDRQIAHGSHSIKQVIHGYLRGATAP